MLRRFHPLVGVLFVIGALASFVALAARYRAEAANRRVALVLDYDQLRQLTTATGVPLDEALRQLKAAGITGVAVTEETIADLQDAGALDVEAQATSTGRVTRVSFSEPALAERVTDHIARFYGATETRPAEGDYVVFPGPGGGEVYVPGRYEDLRPAGIGLNPRAVERINALDLDPVGRIYSALGADPESIRWKLKRLWDRGIDTVIFAGEEVLGFNKLINQTAAAFREFNLLYGSIEFGKQRGDAGLSTQLEDRLVRVHSISPAEMARLMPHEAIERYVRAAAERNIRLNYVRLPVTAGPNTFQSAVQYVDRLSNETARSGFGLASPLPFSRVWPTDVPGRLPAALIALGVGAGAVMLMAGVVPLTGGLQAAFGLVVALACAALALSGVTLGLQLVALLAAVVFPTLGFVLFPQPVGAFEEHEHAAVRDRSEAIVPAVGEFAMISLVTLIGALMVAGLLSELPFLVKTKGFIGIKAATVLPILLVGWIYLTGMTGLYPSWQAERAAVSERLRRFFDEPLRVWHTVAVFVGLAAVALLVLRSGNDPGVGVSDLELRFRVLLDRILGVRPRTKEFAVGHPALLLGLAMAVAPRWRVWAFPLILLGLIGQSGMLNSFCHLHTPIRMTLVRTFNGLWLGGLIGVVLILIWQRLSQPRRRPDASLRV